METAPMFARKEIKKNSNWRTKDEILQVQIILTSQFKYQNK
ncbi:hypothetical protein PPL_00271 [Heterostelium album PN500]|uniref:Uncharacterized protein n=1 Tax=Heterostelium pallidum (strain ATCC 26659 / Pp 5 / PN500) TaxID=670386 RepID=D3AW04_HETP5|nr:hypothetical protein PPL_00271 [Heterostelium album PN500]EFA86477.1 hypothetical protein PPL_00271 [Heterostelium album PN500]|eukprot:XP_020438582.1 hypothetical protein PPL_00271 [Heterostelium album PN500]